MTGASLIISLSASFRNIFAHYDNKQFAHDIDLLIGLIFLLTT